MTWAIHVAEWPKTGPCIQLSHFPHGISIATDDARQFAAPIEKLGERLGMPNRPNRPRAVDPSDSVTHERPASAMCLAGLAPHSSPTSSFRRLGVCWVVLHPSIISPMP